MSEPQSIYASVGELEVKPAAGVWTDPMPESQADQVAFFKKHGFLILRQVFNAEELAEMDAEIQRIARDHEKLPKVREGFDLEPKQDAKRGALAFRKIGGITDLSDAFHQAMKQPRILDMLHAIMGPTIQLWRDVVMMKPARVGREKPWHQDSSYWPWEPMSLVSAMTALDDASPENGCLQVIPDTHMDVLQHYGKELMVDIDDQMQKRTMYVPLQRGDTLLFHSLLLHASEPNLSDQDRRVCIVSYKSPDAKFIGRGEEKDCPLVSQR